MDTSTRLMMKQDKKDNVKLVTITMLLYLIGVVFVFSSSSAELIMTGNDNITSYVEKQLLFGFIAIVLGFIASRLNPNFFIKNQKQIFYFTLALLALVLVIAPEIKGARSWLKIGSFSLQPAEFAKLTLILMASSVLKERNVNTIGSYKKLCLYTLPILMLVVMQGDLGTVMIMGAILLAMMYLGGVEKLLLLAISGAGVIAVLILSVLSPYRIKRMMIFLNPESDYYGMGYQIIQSLYSIANGGLFGQGIGNSVHKFGYLPENHTDFVFSVLAEETGFIGASLVILLFILLIVSILRISFKIQNKQLSLICSGIASYIAIESLLNLFVVVSLMPVTGVTLPFISYGGSSLISKFLAVGIVLCISRNSKRVQGRQLDEERIKQAQERQNVRIKSFEQVKKMKRYTGQTTTNAISNFKNTITNAYSHVTTINKEKSRSLKKKKPAKLLIKKTSKVKKLQKKSKTLKIGRPLNRTDKVRKFKKERTDFIFNNTPQYSSVDLDETFLDSRGANQDFEELTEIDLGTIDLEQFNRD